MTGNWDFVVAAYALTAFATLAVVGQSWLWMRRAERKADALRQER